MKGEAGFSLIEAMIATVILVIALAATLGTLTEAINANSGVTQLAETQENLRAALNYMTQDIIQAGEGIPQGGITIPNNAAGNSNINAPGLPAATFPVAYTTIPAITPRPLAGFPTATPNPAAPGTVILGPNADMITVIYADTTLIDAAGHTLNEFPIFLAPKTGPGCAVGNANPAPAGTITAAAVTFDPTCININTGNTALKPGDLIMFQNANGLALQTISNVGPNTITFLAGDAFNLNATGQPNGTITQIQNQTNNLPNGTYPPTTATRIWMVTYYLDTQTTPLRPQLMRQVNFNPPSPVGDVLEDLGISYDLVENGQTPPIKVNVPQPTGTDSVDQIRNVNLFVAARSEAPYSPTQAYFRNNLATEVSVRNLCFFDQFPITAQQAQ